MDRAGAVGETVAMTPVVTARTRMWTRVAVVTAAMCDILYALFGPTSDAPWVLLLLTCAWLVTAWMGAAKTTWWRGLEGVCVVAFFVADGASPAMGPLAVTGTGVAMTLALRPAIYTTFVLLLSSTIGLTWFNPNPRMPWFGLGFAGGLFFVFGRGMRSLLESQQQAQQLSTRLRTANERLSRALSQASELAAARERARIARELHDSLGHSLTSAHVQLQLAARELPDSRAVTKAQDSTRQAIEELRQCVALMRDERAVRPLSEVLDELVARVPQETFQTVLEVEGEERKLPPEQEFVLFRAAQEGLTNALKHAKPETVVVGLHYGPEGASLCVQDDGRGSNALRVGHGLRGLRERVEAIGGSMEIGAAPGGGFRLFVSTGGSR